MVKHLASKILYTLDSYNLVYRHGVFYKITNKSYEKITSINFSFKHSLACRNRLLTRLLRLEPKSTEQISNNCFVLSFLHKVWLLDAKNKTIQVIQESREGFSDPINFCRDGNSVYWGDYGNNPSRENVNIYKIDEQRQISIVYSFPNNTIRHIHNIIFDKKSNRFWILTGDNEKKSGIYLADSNWENIRPIKIGEQQYRAVVAFPTEDGLLYATDSVDKQNSIFQLSLTNNTITKIIDINGSCIYGTELHDFFIISTTVEPPEGRGIKNLFTYNLGKGIVNREVHLIAISKKDLKIVILKKFKKDILPMKLFQYGVISFPKGLEKANELWYYPIACHKVDGKSFLFSNFDL